MEGGKLDAVEGEGDIDVTSMDGEVWRLDVTSYNEGIIGGYGESMGLWKPCCAGV